MKERDEQEIRRLIERYLAKSMSEQDATAWLELTEQHPELVGELFEHFVLDDMLRDHSRGRLFDSSLAKALSEVIDRRDPYRLRRTISRHPLAVVAVSLSLLLAIGLLFTGILLLRQIKVPNGLEAVAVLPSERPAVRVVEFLPFLGRLTDAVDAVWSEPKNCRVGDDLAVGPLFLQSGLAKIRLGNGATILLNGPVEIRLLAKDRIACLRGRLDVFVPPEAVGFRVDLPETSVIDLGTVFSVDVKESGSEIQVQKGRVAMTNADVKKSVFHAGEALRFLDGVPRPYVADISKLSRIERLAEAPPEQLQAVQNDVVAATEDTKILLPGMTILAQRRGGPSNVDNTISSFREAAALGVDACELDVCASADGVLFVAHPGNVFKIGTREKIPLAKLSAEEIRQLDARTKTVRTEGERIPTLDEALEFFRTETTCFVVVDVFEAGTEQAVIDAIERSGIAERIILTGRFPERIRTLKTLRPSFGVGCCCDATTFPPNKSDTAKRILETANRVHADFVKLEYPLASPELIETLRNAGLPVWVYTVDTESEMIFCLNAGAVAVLTGRADLLVRAKRPETFAVDKTLSPRPIQHHTDTERD